MSELWGDKAERDWALRNAMDDNPRLAQYLTNRLQGELASIERETAKAISPEERWARSWEDWRDDWRNR